MAERPLIWPMRAILYVGGAFVLVAGLQLWLFADRTDEIFAWTIDSRMSAAFIGSFYWAASILALLERAPADLGAGAPWRPGCHGVRLAHSGGNASAPRPLPPG